MNRYKSQEEWLKEKERRHQYALELKRIMEEEENKGIVVVRQFYTYDQYGFMMLDERKFN